MTDYTVTITHEYKITKQDIFDMLVTAAEGGTGYWGCIDTYKPLNDDGTDNLDFDYVMYEMDEEKCILWTSIRTQSLVQSPLITLMAASTLIN